MAENHYWTFLEEKNCKFSDRLVKFTIFLAIVSQKLWFFSASVWQKTQFCWRHFDEICIFSAIAWRNSRFLFRNRLIKNSGFFPRAIDEIRSFLSRPIAEIRGFLSRAINGIRRFFRDNFKNLRPINKIHYFFRPIEEIHDFFAIVWRFFNFFPLRPYDVSRDFDESSIVLGDRLMKFTVLFREWLVQFADVSVTVSRNRQNSLLLFSFFLATDWENSQFSLQLFDEICNLFWDRLTKFTIFSETVWRKSRFSLRPTDKIRYFLSRQICEIRSFIQRIIGEIRIFFRERLRKLTVFFRERLTKFTIFVIDRGNSWFFPRSFNEIRGFLSRTIDKIYVFFCDSFMKFATNWWNSLFFATD